MKRIYFYFSLLIVALIASSCTNFLTEDPKGYLTPDVLIKDKSGLDMAMSGLYNQYRNTGRRTEVQLYMWCGDDVAAWNGGNKGRFLEYDTYNFTPENADLLLLWQLSYSCIKQCNVIIGNADILKTNISDAAFVNNRLGMAHFLRALEYFYLVRCWGPVPLVTAVEVDPTTPRTSVDSVYALIESDVAQAEALLPDKWTVAPYFNYGLNVAPNTGAAKTLEASVWMTEAGWPLNKGAAYYDKAAAKYKEVIDKASTYGYILEPDIKTLVAGGAACNYSKEIVFGCFLSTGDFQNGLCEFPEDALGWGDLYPEIYFYKSFPDGPRKDAYFAPYVYSSAYNKMIYWSSDSTLRRFPLYKKEVDDGYNYYNYDTKSYGDANAVSWGRSGRTRNLFRYADVLLLYAEAVAYGSGGVTADAVNAVLQVQNRAGLADNLKVNTGMSKDAFQQAVLNERKWETCGNEMSVMGRFFTEQRHGILQDQAKTRIVTGDVANTPLNPTFAALTGPDEKFYYFPIPTNETQITGLK